MTDPKPRRDPDHCAAGHDLGICGTYVHPKTGYQECRACRREWVRRSKRRGLVMRPFTTSVGPRSAGDG